jgi:acyl-CoA reductase-like NAD-dependent aldehyde dehydrogenase
MFLLLLQSVLVLFLLGCAGQDRKLVPIPRYPTPSGDDSQRAEEDATEKAEEAEEGRELAAHDSAKALDRIGRLINERKFEEAKRVFDDNLKVIQQTADEGMCNSDHRTSKLYKEFWENLLKMRDILDTKNLTPDNKRSKALQALVDAGNCKKQAAILKLFEH